jgi:signal peptidase I
VSSPLAARTAAAHEPSGALHAIQSLLYIIVIAIFIIGFSMQPYRIPSGSMEPTLLVGDFLLVDKQLVPPQSERNPLPLTTIQHGDIIVFHYPIDTSVLLVKRVVGLPGDHIRLREGRVYRNGQLLTEPYAVYRPAGPDSFRDNFPRMQSADPGVDAHWWIEMRHRIDHGDLVIPANHFFVLGDNRNDSEDSRYWGFVPRTAIVGKPFLIYFSLRQDERSDPSAVPQFNLPLRSSRIEEALIDRIADFAHWDRTLHIVR